MGSDAEIALSKLVVALRDEAPCVRGCAVGAIVELASLTDELAARVRERIHEVEALLSDDAPHVRSSAERVIGGPVPYARPRVPVRVSESALPRPT